MGDAVIPPPDSRACIHHEEGEEKRYRADEIANIPEKHEKRRCNKPGPYVQEEMLIGPEPLSVLVFERILFAYTYRIDRLNEQA